MNARHQLHPNSQVTDVLYYSIVRCYIMLMVRIMEMLGGVSNTRIPPVIRGAQGKEEKGQKKSMCC